MKTQLRHTTRGAIGLILVLTFTTLLYARGQSKIGIQTLLDEAGSLEGITGITNAVQRLQRALPDFRPGDDRARLLLAVGDYALRAGEGEKARTAWREAAAMEAASASWRTEAYLKLAAAESYPPQIVHDTEAALALKGLTDTDRARVLLALANRRQADNFYDQGLEILERVLQLEDIPVALQLAALRDQGKMARELRRKQVARDAFERLIALDGVPPDQLALAHVELIETILSPMQYAWIPTEADLQQALQVYARAKDLPALTATLRSRALMGIARAQRLADQPAAAIETAQLLLADKRLSSLQTAQAHDLIGDNYMDLKNFKKAVAHYEHALRADKYAVLNKLAKAARFDGNFNRAMQAYADLVPMIDKVEAKDDYRRVTRLLVAMTEATRRMMKTPAAADVFRTEGDRALGAITLDDDI